jgi:predicted ATPase
MKNAALESIWRSAQTTPAGTSILGLSLDELKGISGTNLSFEGPLVAICGFNGTGKTTLLNALRALLGGAGRAPVDRYDARVQNAHVKATLKFRGKSHDLMKPPGHSTNRQIPDELAVHFFNPTYDAVTLQRTLQDRGDIPSLMNGIEGQSFGREELEEISRIIGKTYSAITAFDLSQEFLTARDEASGSVVDSAAGVDGASSAIEELSTVALRNVPYFEVTVGAVKYDSRSMGLGELATIYLYWSLQSVQRGAIVLLEEPESFITPASQPALGAVLAKFASEKKFTIIFTSHSEPLVSRLSTKNLIVNIPQMTGESKATTAEDADEHLQILRLNPRKVGMVICEDWGGVAFLRGLLRRKSHPALTRFDFIPAFGEGNVAKLLACYPRRGGVTPMFGVLDGDVRTSFSEKGHFWPHCFLPGDVAPEKILIEKFKEFLDDFCADRDIKKRTAEIAISATDGLDYHDVIGQLTRALPCSHEDIVNFVVRRLTMDTEWAEQIDQFFESLERCLEAID